MILDLFTKNLIHICINKFTEINGGIDWINNFWDARPINRHLHKLPLVYLPSAYLFSICLKRIKQGGGTPATCGQSNLMKKVAIRLIYSPWPKFPITIKSTHKYLNWLTYLHIWFWMKFLIKHNHRQVCSMKVESNNFK